MSSGQGGPTPTHVAIIMDGNGRWAQMRGLPRQEGHRRGLEALRRTVRNASDLGIGVLTLYSFSTENWRRPQAEVSFLMGLLRHFVEKDLAELSAANVQVRIIGSRQDLAPDLRRLVEHAEARTRGNTGLILAIAFNYGARDEIVRAARALAADAAAGRVEPRAIDEAALSARLDTHDLPDPELVIRTSGETRISNFLLWQAAYAEFVFTPVMWPDFDRAAFEDALAQYRQRERRFGGLSTPPGRSVGVA
ncbi:isoprenyl transferase [Bosea minatitlanensis]|uniref:Isoprenyl transferase n=1 Tax=Bosea minatitlanensis TaxID=128782 RepID=A0ABW0F6A4_9HYPH|nr:isoprenyl transferase [Bosea minatitlanensis]MCT4493837.1 isoprenyl transferase [Bosea minatitlanensis]